MLPCFIKAEDQSRGASKYYDAGGPFAVTDLPDRHEMCDAFIEVALANGIPRNEDFNGASQEGAGYSQANTRNGARFNRGGLRAPGREACKPSRWRRRPIARDLAEGAVCAQHGWWVEGAAGTPYDREHPLAANLNQVIDTSRDDPVSGSIPLRARWCEVEKLVT
jgi:choline dehydrogenase-like flavoprotein